MVALASGESLPIGDYHYLTNLDEAQGLAAQLDRMVKDAS